MAFTSNLISAILLATLIQYSKSIHDDDNNPEIASGDGGKPHQQGRVITQGKEPTEDVNPFQVGIMIDGEFRCSGSFVVVSKLDVQVVLSAAQCFYQGYPDEFSLIPLKDISIYFGLDYRTYLYNAKDAKPKQILINEDYDPNFFTNDIAIIFLDKVIPIERGKIEPIEMAEKGWPLPSKVIVSGWGTQFLGQNLLGTFRQIEVVTMNIGDCHEYDSTVTDRQFCVNGGGKKRGPCSRDQGGPAIWKNSSDNKNYLYGIISYNTGYVCGHPTVPSVLTRISEFYYWIQNNVFYNRP